MNRLVVKEEEIPLSLLSKKNKRERERERESCSLEVEENKPEGTSPVQKLGVQSLLLFFKISKITVLQIVSILMRCFIQPRFRSLAKYVICVPAQDW